MAKQKVKSASISDLQHDLTVKEGDSVQFKDNPRWWLVEKTYLPHLDKGDIKHGWKVGGLT